MFILDIITWRLILSENGIRASWCQNAELNHSRLYSHHSALLEAPSSSNGAFRSALPLPQMKSLTKKDVTVTKANKWAKYLSNRLKIGWSMKYFTFYKWTMIMNIKKAFGFIQFYTLH